MSTRKQVHGYEGLYEVTDSGHVISKHKESMGLRGELCHRYDKNGYIRVRLVRNGKEKDQHVARVVLMAFHGIPPTNKHEANHKDGNKKNNSIGNLEWVTPIQNTHHAIKNSLVAGRSLCVVEVDGKQRNLADVCRELNVNYQVAHHRIRNGWSLTRALSEPTIGFRTRSGAPLAEGRS